MQGVNDNKNYLTFKFKMKDFAEVNTIFKIKIKKHNGGVYIVSHYINKLLSKFKNLGIKEANTPFDVSNKFKKFIESIRLC